MTSANMGGAAQPEADEYRLLADWLAGNRQAWPVLNATQWMHLVELARDEGVAPLFAQAVRDFQSAELPAAADEALTAAYRQAACVRLLQQAIQDRLCGRLAERGIPVLLLKGAALAVTCYSDPATRPMRDLDLLVPRSRLAEATRCLEEDSFRLRSLPRSLIPTLNQPRAHFEYVHSTTQIIVELHWELKMLGRSQSEPLIEIWSHASPAPGVAGAKSARLGHTLPLQCAHITRQHNHATLLWLFDLHCILSAMDADEAALARDAAERWHLVPYTAHALVRTRELFGTRLPEELEEWATEAACHDDRRSRLVRFALTQDVGERPPTGLARLVLNGDLGFLRGLLPSPDALRDRLDLAPDESVFPAYTALMARHLRRSPSYFRRLWRAVARHREASS